MEKDIEITLLPEELHKEVILIKALSQKLNLNSQRIKGYRVLKRSIDARSRKVVYRMQVRVYVDEPALQENLQQNYPNVTSRQPVIIVGAGPAGLFAALQCLENGYRPVVIERGKDVRQRRRDLAAINKLGLINTESNYCYGEGGAGTYSDGKLYTRSNKRGDINKVLKVFVEHGATEDILIDARPHIGTNKLPHIITSIRETIIKHGGEVHFAKKVTDLIIESGAVKGVVANGVEKYLADSVILATGHSARDIYQLLFDKRITVEPKPFALGVRIEHPQTVIDTAQYHCEIRSEYLPPAYYSLVEQVGERGVFSFCMCPGGIIAPCSTGENEVVVNGWSPSRRNNPYANSGTVVQVALDDVPGDHPLKMMYFQEEVERKAFEFGGGNLVAPAQRMKDFVEDRVSTDLPQNSYLPGTRSVMLKEVLPDFVYQSLKKALPEFGRKMKGYYTNDAILVGVESRTSSPVRIPRNKENYQHPEVKGLYPCAEGAGYAGGIVSAAIDGINCANAVADVRNVEHEQVSSLKTFYRLQRYISMKKSLIIGANPNPTRYAYKAAQMLKAKGHPIINVGIKKGEVAGVEIERPEKIHDNVHTITLYIRPEVQKDYYDYIVKTDPKRVIFNPGTENPELEELLDEYGIEPVSGCTLVMLATGQY